MGSSRIRMMMPEMYMDAMFMCTMRCACISQVRTAFQK